MSSSAHGTTPYYFVPEPSRHPAMAAFGLFCMIFGGSAVDQRRGLGHVPAAFRAGVWLFAILFQWFRDAVRRERALASTDTRSTCRSAGA
jgi:cytochrome c oxidase subunit 3